MWGDDDCGGMWGIEAQMRKNVWADPHDRKDGRSWWEPSVFGYVYTYIIRDGLPWHRKPRVCGNFARYLWGEESLGEEKFGSRRLIKLDDRVPATANLPHVECRRVAWGQSAPVAHRSVGGTVNSPVKHPSRGSRVSMCGDRRAGYSTTHDAEVELRDLSSNLDLRIACRVLSRQQEFRSHPEWLRRLKEAKQLLPALRFKSAAAAVLAS